MYYTFAFTKDVIKCSRQARFLNTKSHLYHTNEQIHTAHIYSRTRVTSHVSAGTKRKQMLETHENYFSINSKLMKFNMCHNDCIHAYPNRKVRCCFAFNHWIRLLDVESYQLDLRHHWNLLTIQLRLICTTKIVKGHRCTHKSHGVKLVSVSK